MILFAMKICFVTDLRVAGTVTRGRRHTKHVGAPMAEIKPGSHILEGSSLPTPIT
jgi:hypothetical protein